MLTVNETLALEPFHTAKVVAGRGGLYNPVAWVHNVGVPDAAQWLNGGELILTTANNMPADLDGQKKYIRQLVDKGIAGLIVAVGKLIDTIEPKLYPLADRHNFPLIEIPYTARFVDLARTANELIAQENMAQVRRSLEIHKTLTNLVLEGGGIQELAQQLATLINQSVSVETERF